jgi:hypothetical protein
MLQRKTDGYPGNEGEKQNVHGSELLSGGAGWAIFGSILVALIEKAEA